MSEQWTAESYPAVPLDAKFRQDLQRALEQTHRQQAVQRKLGTGYRRGRRIRIRWITAALLCLLISLAIVRWLRADNDSGASL